MLEKSSLKSLLRIVNEVKTYPVLFRVSILLDQPSNQQPRRLKKGSKFSQEDLLSGNLRYRLTGDAAPGAGGAPLNDEFRFVVRGRAAEGSGRGGGAGASAAVAMVSAVQTFSVIYVAGDDDVDVNLETLEVEEGAKKAISEKYLNIRDGRLILELSQLQNALCFLGCFDQFNVPKISQCTM